MYTRVKICGIGRIEDARAAVDAGADAIGLVFYQASPRHVSIQQARQIVRALPPFISIVGLFVDAAEEGVRAVLSEVSLNLIQFHGREPAEFCRQFGVPYIKAIRMSDGVELKIEQERYPDAAGLLLDSNVPGVAGGSGQTFDWARIPSGINKPVILSGGLNAENVREAIRRVRPYAVDVSSGVERTKGVKDAAKIAAFVRAVRETA